MSPNLLSVGPTNGLLAAAMVATYRKSGDEDELRDREPTKIHILFFFFFKLLDVSSPKGISVLGINYTLVMI